MYCISGIEKNEREQENSIKVTSTPTKTFAQTFLFLLQFIASH